MHQVFACGAHLHTRTHALSHVGTTKKHRHATLPYPRPPSLHLGCLSVFVTNCLLNEICSGQTLLSSIDFLDNKTTAVWLLMISCIENGFCFYWNSPGPQRGSGTTTFCHSPQLGTITKVLGCMKGCGSSCLTSCS